MRVVGNGFIGLVFRCCLLGDDGVEAEDESIDICDSAGSGRQSVRHRLEIQID